MFGTTDPIFSARGVASEYVRNPDLAQYVRWEYSPADRSSVIRSIRRHGTAARHRVRVARLTGIVRRVRSWVKALRGAPGGPIESGVVYRAMLRQKVL